MNTEIELVNSGSVTSPRGFSAGAVYSGIKKDADNVLDLGVLFSEARCTAAGLFTTNMVQAAPVIVSQKKVQSGTARAVIVNSGCANACTGEQGLKDAAAMADALAARLGIPAGEVLVASTGVIGVLLPLDRIKEGVGKLVLSPDGGHNLARAIMTTDTRPKEVAVRVKAGDSVFTIGGVAKGAGMIHPNMATMLSFLTTDAAVDTGFLKTALQKAVAISLNMVSVDGDTSTNDTIMILANGMAGNQVINTGDKLAGVFQMALERVCIHLAKKIARDGEGATRLMDITVSTADSEADARIAARTIATSFLVKTAVHGCDPNWGRIVAAAGRSGAKLDPGRVDLSIGGVPLLQGGRPLPFDKKKVAGILGLDEVFIHLDLNLGPASATAWGCDLSEEYVQINSEYTT